LTRLSFSVWSLTDRRLISLASNSRAYLDEADTLHPFAKTQQLSASRENWSAVPIAWMKRSRFARSFAKSQSASLAETRRDLLAHELQRAHDFFITEQTPAIELRQDAIEAELAGQILKAHRHRCWSSDNHFIA